MSDCVVLFARAAVPGTVKTRLAQTVGAIAAASIHAAFVSDLVARLGSRVSHDLVLYHHPEDAGDFLRALGVRLEPQRGEELGIRMENAIQSEAGLGAGRVVIIGADSPDLPVSRIDQAFSALDEASLVLGPATDGGYYLVGVRGQPHPALFHDIPWGDGTVLQTTLLRARSAQVRTALLEPWYDIDRPGDLVFLRTHLDGLLMVNDEDRCPATRAVLANLATLCP